MKRQFLYKQSGFTLFELMLVITILAIFFAATASFSWKPRTDAEKADLLAVSIGSRLRTEMQNVAIGRMPQRNGRLLAYSEITIGTGGMIIVYKTGATATSSLGGSNFVVPFLDGDPKYEIANVVWTGSSIPPSLPVTGTGLFIIEPSGITFSGGAYPSDIKNQIYLELRIRYGSSTRKITIDRRTGKITERKF